MMRLMRYAHLGVVLFAAACGSSSKSGELTDGGGGGGGGGGGDGTGNPSGCTSFATLLPFDTCKLPFDSDLILDGTFQYNTDTHTLTGSPSVPVVHTAVVTDQQVRIGVDAIIARNVTLLPDAHLRAIGKLPFAIIAAGNISLAAGAQIDVSDGGAGKSYCNVGFSATEGYSNSCRGAGGGGAGFAANGGGGGDGCTPRNPIVGGGRGRAFSGLPVSPAAGCSGAAGGSAGGAGDAGSGGAGGGALYLVAANRIELAGGAIINAGGGSGRGGRHSGGGGGGGAGGALLLEAPHIGSPPDAPSSGAIVANGGGGGGGADATTNGSDGSPASTTTTPTNGGTGAGVNGGRGGSREHPDGEDVTEPSVAGGAGGGGSVGIIWINTADLKVETISPAAAPH